MLQAILNIELDEIKKLSYLPAYTKEGYASYIKEQAKQILPLVTGNDGDIDGTALQSRWFPVEKTFDVFISHSHNDENEALILKNWLQNECGLECFLDGDVWNSADALLLEIDNKYCLKEDGSMYFYNRRNLSTSHVHAMLSTAILEAIYRSRLFIFIKSKQSLKLSDIKSKTLSPWLYEELTMANRLIEIPIEKRKRFSEGGILNEQLNIMYDVSKIHSVVIDAKNLEEWRRGKEVGMTSQQLGDYIKDLYYKTILKD